MSSAKNSQPLSELKRVAAGDLSACRVGSLLLEHSQDVGTGTICAVFSSSFAIRCESLVYTVSGLQGGLPLGMELETQPTGMECAMVGKHVTFSPLGLTFPELDWRITWEAAQQWDGKQKIESITVERQHLAERAFFIKNWVRQNGVSLGGSRLLQEDCTLSRGSGLWTETLTETSGYLLQLLRSGRQDGNRGRIQKAAYALMGLGPGLTPSGDDFLTGLILCLFVARYASAQIAQNLLSLTACVQRHWKDGTNPFSGSYLYAAARGHAPGAVFDVLKAIWAGSDDLEPALRKLRTVGGTSGTDTLLGVAAGIELALPSLV